MGFQDLTDICKSDHTEVINYNGTQEETFMGDITGQCFTHLKYGEALENIKSTAKTVLHTQEQLLEVHDKIEPLDVTTKNLLRQIDQVRKETGDLGSRAKELQYEKTTKGQKLSNMES